MKTLSVEILRRMMAGTAIIGLALGSAVVLTACESDTPPASSTERAERSDADERSANDRQVADADLREEPTRQEDRDRQVTGEQQQRQLESMSTDALLGVTVRSRSENEDIGTVSEVLVDSQGNSVGVLVDVEEFMGMGEKQVAFDWDKISLEQAGARTGTGGSTDDSMDTQQGSQRDQSMTIVVDVTREEIKNAPAFDRQAWERQQASSNDGDY